MTITGKLYIIRNMINNMVYIGCTTNSLKQRFNEHVKSTYDKMKNKRILYRHMRMYGYRNYHIELIDEYRCDSLHEIRQKESEIIKYYKNLGNCYNIRN